MTRQRRLDDLRRLGVVHGLGASADAFFAVSLAGSLFFNVSVEAARPRLLFYLLVTVAPFVVLAPLIGPFVDRVRGGQRTVLAVACFGRAALTLALVEDLRTLLMFPEAFAVLVLGKAYSIGRSATVPRLVTDETKLVSANASLARIGLVAIRRANFDDPISPTSTRCVCRAASRRSQASIRTSIPLRGRQFATQPTTNASFGTPSGSRSTGA